jgi:hypothetical protein
LEEPDLDKVLESEVSAVVAGIVKCLELDFGRESNDGEELGKCGVDVRCCGDTPGPGELLDGVGFAVDH